MTRKARDVTEAELDVLQVLWERGPQTIREVAAILDRRNQDAYYATVKKLLERLDAKGFVSREPAGSRICTNRSWVGTSSSAVDCGKSPRPCATDRSLRC